MKILRSIPKFLSTRNGLRILSVVAAIVVWYAIRAATGNSTLVTGIPLAVQPPNGWVLVDTSAKSVDVAFLGTRDDIRFLNRELIKASVDARAHTDTTPWTLTLGPANINAPGSSRIDFIRPSTVTIKLDREISKQVPVKVETQNLLPDGYEMDILTVTPATVELTGPEQRLKNIESVSTVPVDLDGRVRSIKRRLALVPGDNTGGVRLDPIAVTLDMPILERSVTSRFPDMPVQALLPPARSARADLSPETVTLTVKGRPELMKNLESEDIRLFVDATDITDSSAAKRSVRAHLPPGVTLVRTEPANLTVRIHE